MLEEHKMTPGGRRQAGRILAPLPSLCTAHRSPTARSAYPTDHIVHVPRLHQSTVTLPAYSWDEVLIARPRTTKPSKMNE